MAEESDNIDGLPGPLRTMVLAARPLAVAALVAIPTAGPLSVALVSIFSMRAAMNMTRVSVAFLQGIPGEIVLLIGGAAGVYIGGKTVEQFRSRPRAAPPEEQAAVPGAGEPLSDPPVARDLPPDRPPSRATPYVFDENASPAVPENERDRGATPELQL